MTCKEVGLLTVPSGTWTGGAWDSKREPFYRLGKMIGLNTPVSPEDLQGAYQRVATPKVFAESVQSFVESTELTLREIQEQLEVIEALLGTLDPVRFRSLHGTADPRMFRGIAFLTTGTGAWSDARYEQLRMAMKAGAVFGRVICLGSTRKCGAPADRRYPPIGNVPQDEAPSERTLLRQLVGTSSLFRFPDLPELNAEGKPLTLEQQLQYLVESGQYADLVGDADVYIPTNANALYMPLHAARVLGLHDVWFSQAGAKAYRQVPESWWPSDQSLMTIPQGIIRLWVELLHAGCMTP